MSRRVESIAKYLKENAFELEYDGIVRDNVLKALNAKNMTLEQLANALHCSKSHAHNLVSGKASFYVFEIELLVLYLNDDKYTLPTFFRKPDTEEVVDEQILQIMTRMGVPKKAVYKVILILVNALKEILKIIC